VVQEHPARDHLGIEKVCTSLSVARGHQNVEAIWRGFEHDQLIQEAHQFLFVDQRFSEGGLLHRFILGLFEATN
jgi:hypothetical protein